MIVLNYTVCLEGTQSILPLHVSISCYLIPPPHQVTTGSSPPMALLYVCTVTSTGSVVVMDQVHGLVSDPNQVCLSNWTYISSPVRTCGRGLSNGRGCNSVFYSTFGMTYTRVCGRIIAYQHGSPDATRSDINGIYLDGVSLTHGIDNTSGHLSVLEEKQHQICACSSSNPMPHSTSFVGEDYFCDSGNHVNTYNLYIYILQW